MWGADRDRAVEGNDKTTNVLNSLKEGRIGVLQPIRIIFGMQANTRTNLNQ